MELQQSELQRALLTLFNHSEQTQNMNTFLLNLFKAPQSSQAQAQEVEQQQQFQHQNQQPQQQHHMNPEACLNEYYMRLFASRHATSNQDFGSGNAEDYPVPSAKRFKAAPVDQQQQFQSLLLNKYLPTSPAAQHHPQKHQHQPTSKRLSSEDIPHHHNFTQKQALSNSTLSSSSTSSDMLNTSPRSLLSNSDESASSSNSAENVSPLDALLHLANSTFTSHFQHGHGQRHDTEASQQQQHQALLLNNIYKLKKHGMYVNDENNGLLGN